MNRELIVDNFAGGGGASTGIWMATGRYPDFAINHDPEALAMHEANHPETVHLPEDVFAIDPVALCAGRPVVLAWFSPDCKHFSKAKGAKPKSKKIRGLAWVMVKWAAKVRPRVMLLENVNEFKTWGPLLSDGKPCPRRKGNTFRNFVARLRNLGYAVEWRELRASDFGAGTIRKRLYLIARCDGQPIVWPEPTHGRPGGDALLKPWRTAAESIDWALPCPSIFERKRPLAEATMRRIARGIFKFVINTAEPFVVNVANSKTTGRGPNAWANDEPLRTVTASSGFAAVVPHVQKYHGERRPGEGSRAIGLEEPLHTQSTENRFGFVSAHVTKFRTGSTGSEMSEPLPTVTAGPKADPAGAAHALGVVHATIAPLLTECANASTQRVFDPAEPMRTQCAEIKGGHFAAVSAFLAKHYTERGPQVQGSDARDPMATITALDHNALVTSHLSKLYGTTTGSDLNEPMHTVTGGGNHIAEVRAFLIKYYGQGGQDQSAGDPMHTITAKDRVGLVTIHGEEYIITDIGMRMLEPHELFAAQGFPSDYIIAPVVNRPRGVKRPLPKHAQVRMCGNSVCPPVAAALVAANLPEMCNRMVEAAA